LNTIADWEMVMDGIQILLGLIVLALVGLKRSKSKRFLSGLTADATDHHFSEEMIRQSVKQQVLESLDQVIRTALAEKSNISHMFDDQVAWKNSDGAPFHDSLESEPFSDPTDRPDAPSATSIEKYAAIEKMARQGHDTRNISETLDLPAGEVSLLLKLRQAAGHPRATIQ